MKIPFLNMFFFNLSDTCLFHVSYFDVFFVYFFRQVIHPANGYYSLKFVR